MGIAAPLEVPKERLDIDLARLITVFHIILRLDPSAKTLAKESILELET